MTDITDKARFYQKVSLWPRTTKLNYKGWLSNFENGDDLELAKKILDFFVYYSDDLVDQLIIAAVGRCGYKLQELNGGWSYNDFKEKCWYGFVPGEHPHDSDSGHIFIRKVRDVLRVDERRELNFPEILQMLASESTPQNVILVDDFVGSGSQCCTAWNCLKLKTGSTLADLCMKIPHNIFYAPLVINHDGYRRIKANCHNLNLETVHILDDEYNLFNSKCLCWNNDPNLYKRGTEMILRKSRVVGIPEDDVRNPLYIRGLQEQGLAIAFEHGIPDACPPFFYWDQNGWTPLIKKQYPR
ncbi:MAG: hypothetical protein IJ669_02960 [Prevotella sp.]|nr:hypothetical protein [Prevotella sp.]